MRSPRTSPNGDCRLCNKSAMVGRWAGGAVPCLGKGVQGNSVLATEFCYEPATGLKSKAQKQASSGLWVPISTRNLLSSIMAVLEQSRNETARKDVVGVRGEVSGIPRSVARSPFLSSLRHVHSLLCNPSV